MEETTVKTLENALIEKQKIIERQEQRIQELNGQLNEFLSEIYWRGPVNERNAGRRSVITSQLREDVHKLKNEHKPIRTIASELKISVGTVHKILNSPMR